MRSHILGTGRFVPDQVVTNDDLAARMDTSDAWIVQRTGIRERRHVDFARDPMATSDMAARAAERALAAAGRRAAEVDMVVYATLSPDRFFPGDGVALAAKLGCPAGTPAMDVRNQCSGFLYALSAADAFVRAGVYRHVLVVGAELHSTGLDFSSRGRDVAVLFGDGAAACLVGPSPDAERGILAVRLHADGRHVEDLQCLAPASSRSPRITHQDLEDGLHFPKMHGPAVFKHAAVRMPEVIEEALAAAGHTTADIGLLICHQANLRIIEAAQKRLGVGDERVFNNIERYGNTTAASIPLALDEAIEMGRAPPGTLLVMGAFGAGFTWGGAVVQL